MLREHKRYKAISFKQAWVIVISLHVFALVGFMQWSSYKAKLAKEAREAKRAQLLSETQSHQDWNTQHIKPKVVALAPTPKPTPDIKQPSINPIEMVTSALNDIKNSVAPIAQKDISNEIKQTFLNGKKQLTQSAQIPKVAPKTNSVAVSIISSKPKQNTVIAKKAESSSGQQTSSQPVTTIVKTTSTYFTKGLDYRSEEQITQRLSSHIKL